MKYCDSGHGMPSHEHFCSQCGEDCRSVADMTCPDGHRIKREDRYCPECGKILYPTEWNLPKRPWWKLW